MSIVWQSFIFLALLTQCYQMSFKIDTYETSTKIPMGVLTTEEPTKEDSKDTPPTPKLGSLSFKVTGPTSTYICMEGLGCQSIKEYFIERNASMDCYTEKIPITFEVMDALNRKHGSSGFLPQYRGEPVTTKQEISSICRPIKK